MATIDNAMIHSLIQHLGGKSNIQSVTNCMTRLRVTLHDSSVVDKDELKKIQGVLGVVEADEQLQLILGPGKATKAAEMMKASLGDNMSSPSLQEIARTQKQQIKSAQTSSIHQFFAKFATIFSGFYWRRLTPRLSNRIATSLCGWGRKSKCVFSGFDCVHESVQ